MEPDYISINRKAWNDKVDAHVHSEFYNVAGFLNGSPTYPPTGSGCATGPRFADDYQCPVTRLVAPT